MEDEKAEFRAENTLFEVYFLTGTENARTLLQKRARGH
jgi:hypothetical protein